MLAVSGLGAPTYDVAAAGDHERNFYLWGAMGGAALVGLGLALAQPKPPVVVVTGDGEMLMGLGGLATVALQNPGNLSIVVLDNGPTAKPVVRRAIPRQPPTSSASPRRAGSKIAGDVDARRGRGLCGPLQDVTSGPRFASVKIDAANLERVLSSRDGTFIVNRIRGSLGHQPFSQNGLLRCNKSLTAPR